MAEGHKRRLVVDASVARAASAPPSLDPPGGPCRRFLEEMRDLEYRLAMSGELFAEWRRHRSVFAQTWLSQMYARKRVDRLRAVEDRIAFDDKLAAAVLKQRERAAVVKDRHLVLLAMMTDRAVVSLDEEMRGLLRERTPSLRAALRMLDWVNPTHENDAAILWLREGAKSGSRKLQAKTGSG